MNNTQVAERFRAGETKGTGSNMFIEGDTIYSYGYHFAIAKHSDERYRGLSVVYFNYNDYSKSTQKQKGHILRELSDYFYLVEVNDPRKPNINDIKLHEADIEYYSNKLSRARVEYTKRYYRDMIEHAKEQKQALITLLNIDDKPEIIEA